MRQPEAGTIRTDAPSRLKRVPWARWYRMVPAGSGVVRIPDGSGRRAQDRRGNRPAAAPAGGRADGDRAAPERSVRRT